MAVLGTSDGTLNVALSEEIEQRFFQLLEMDRETDDFLARFWEFDRLLEQAVRVEGLPKDEPGWNPSGRS